MHKFIVKFIVGGITYVNGIYENFLQAKAITLVLVATEASEAWIELDGYPELRTASVFPPPPPEPECPPPPPCEPEPAPEPEHRTLFGRKSSK